MSAEALEMARCAACNLDAFAAALPPGLRHPLLFAARLQLEEAIAGLEGRPPPAGGAGLARDACALASRAWPWRHGLAAGDPLSRPSTDAARAAAEAADRAALLAPPLWPEAPRPRE